jgi:endonuclease YncB( thermonuclease family)
LICRILKNSFWTVLLEFLPILALAYDLQYPAELVRVVDGDTTYMTVTIWPGLEQTVSVRVLDVDAPELHGSTECERSPAAAAELFSKSFLKSVILKSGV